MPPEQSVGSADSSSRRRTHSKPNSATSASPNTSAATVTAVLQHGQHDTADAAMYKEMREALAEFDSQNLNNNFDPYSTREKPQPRDKAFYAALRSVLGQVLQEKTEDARHTRLLAAHQWYVKHKPRPKPRDMDMAAAMAASLSVSCPVNGDATAAGTSAGVTSGGSPSSRQQQQQQQFVLYGKPRHVNSARFAEQQQQQHTAEDEGIPAYNSSRTARWQEQQQRMHADADADEQCSPPTNSASAESVSPALQRPTQHLPEQPSMRHMPAIQDHVRGTVHFSSSKGASVEAGADSGPMSWASCSGNGNAAKSVSSGTDGLIPLGSLPSARYTYNPSSGSGGARYTGAPSDTGANFASSTGGSCDGNSIYEANKAQWQAVAGAQQRVEAAVAAQMQGYCRHRARLEEEISRKQEVTAQMTKVTSQSNSVSNRPHNSGRVLVHVDSQHQPSEVSAYQWAGGRPDDLVPVNKVKEAKKKLLQESEQELAEVTQQLAELGVTADPAVLEHALMPVPDQAYMVCLAHLPKPGLGIGTAATGASGAGKEKKKTKKKSKSKASKKIR